MTYEEYRESIKNNMKNYLPEEYKNAKVMINEVTKNNNIKLYGVGILKEGTNMTPTVYLEDSYQKYQNGTSMEDILQKLAGQYLRGLDVSPEFSADDFAYEKVKDRVFPALINAEFNQELLKSVPHKEVEDLAVVYRVHLGSDNSGMATVQIQNSHLKLWGIDSETLDKQAMENLPKLFPAEVHSMDYIMAEIMGMPVEDMEEDLAGSPMNVLTNSNKMFGASYMLYPELLKSIGEQMDGNYAILPSSIHELILVKEAEGMDMEALKEMVNEVNATQVEPDEVLSNEVYYYDTQKQELSLYSQADQNMSMGM